MKLLVAGTGHRPDKLGGWENEIAYHQLISFVASKVLIHNEAGVVSGGACGWDLALAEGAIHLGIPVMMAIPFEGQEARWSSFWKRRYNYVMENAAKINILFTPNRDIKHEVVKALHGRNDWMVEYIKSKNGKIYALWNGTKGGTAHCVRSAERRRVEVVNFWRGWDEGKKENPL